MINDGNFKSPGTELNRMMDRLGFADQVGDVYGAALDGAVGNDPGVARNLLDAYSPFSTSQLDDLTRKMSSAAFMSSPRMYFPTSSRDVQGYNGPQPSGFPNATQMHQIVSSMFNRLNPQNFASVLERLNPGTSLSASQNLPEVLGKTFEQLIASMEGKIEQKLDQQAQAPVGGKKRKKKGGLSKLKKKFKSVAKFAKKTFQTVTKPFQKTFGTFLNALKSGNIFEMGRALTGGLIGGPVGGFLLENLMSVAGRKNPIHQVFKQVHKTFDVIEDLHRQKADLQRSLLPKFLR